MSVKVTAKDGRELRQILGKLLQAQSATPESVDLKMAVDALSNFLLYRCN